MNVAALRSAVRAAIVIPAVFALTDKLIAQPQVSLLAAFGSFAIVVFTEFAGTWRARHREMPLMGGRLLLRY